jgi:hypothetical protein
MPFRGSPHCLPEDALFILRGVAQHTQAVGGVGSGVWILVRHAVKEERQQLLGVRRYGVLHVLDAVCDDADAGAALASLGGTGILEKVLRYNVPDLRTKKGDGSLRLVVDYRGLNEGTINPLWWVIA